MGNILIHLPKYSDIQQQLKREFNVNKYAAIKRGKLELAKDIIRSYKAPLYLLDLISMANDQIELKVN